MATELRPTSDLAISPGEYLAEVAEELGLTQSDLAERMNRPPQAINEIIAGSKAIMADTALQLERVTGVPAHIWTNLEADYRLTLARQQDEQSLKEQCGLVADFPYRELEKLGVVGKTRKTTERVGELCRFFGVASLRQIPHVSDYAPAFRAGKGEVSRENLAAWLRVVTLRALRVETKDFDRDALLKSVPQFRRLTKESPEVFVPRLSGLLAESGVALVLCPHFPRTFVHGAAYWLSPGKAVVAATIRGRWADVFWFSFFHELGHLVLRHSKKEVFLEDGNVGGQRRDLEDEADAYSRDTLIPPRELGQFLATGDPTTGAIRDFARRIEIAPGVVVGRLQHDGHLPKNHHALRIRYVWAESDE